MRIVGSAALAALCALAMPAAASAASTSSVARFFSWRAPIPPDLRAALDNYEDGRLLDAVAAADRGLRSSDPVGYRDDLYLVRGLALAALGWRKEAAESFAAVLETSDPSPYYPLALLGLVESEHRDGRFQAVAEAYHRYFERPWHGRSRRDKLVRNFLTTFGDLRTSALRLDPDEADLMTKPAKLAEKLARRKERPSERLLYLCGLDLFRAGDYAASLEALERIGIVSFYAPYALYTGAQDLYALGRLDGARAKLALLFRYPALAREDQALLDRAGLLLVELLFDSGRVDDALAASRRVDGDGRFALAARLLRAEIYLATDQPSLALAFYQDLNGKELGPRLDAERALDLGAAYAKLGDLASAGASLQTAADEVSRALSHLGSTEGAQSVAEIRASVERQVAADRAIAAADRRRVAAGIRRVSSFKGPLNLGKVVRVVFAPHRNTILGEPVYDVALLAESDRPVRAEPTAADGLWVTYLQSPSRGAVEEAMAARLEIEGADGDRDRALSALSALLGALDGRFASSDADADAEAARIVTRIGREISGGAGEVEVRTEAGAPLGADVAASRRRLLDVLAADPAWVAIDPALAEQARRAALERLDDAIASGLARVAAAESEDLRRLEFQLRAELSETLAKQSGIAHSATETEPR